MANNSLSRLERLYLMLQSTFLTIPNSSGTATVANANACRHIKFSANNEVGMLVRQDKTGARTATQGVVGRKHGKWATEMSLAPNGVAGVVPDCDPILQSMFGQAATVGAGTTSIASSTNATPIVVTATGHGLTAGTKQCVTISGHLVNTAANGVWVVSVVDANTFSLLGSVGVGVGAGTGTVSKVNVKYTLSDTPLLTFAAFSFRQPSTLNQRCAFGCAVDSATFNLGQDIATWTADGECAWVYESDFHSSADTTQLGGLTVNLATSAEPTTPVTNGGIIAGFTGRAVINGTNIANIKTATVKFGTGAAVIKDLFGSYYADSVEADERNVTVSFTFYDNDDTATVALRNLGLTKTAVDIVLQVGTTAGSVAVLFLRGVQIAATSLDDSARRFVGTVSESRAFGSSITAKDELTLWMT